MKKNNLITVVMCAYNNERTIKRAIQSVINQDYPFWKLKIILSKSTDKTLEICQLFNDTRIQIISKSEPQSWTKSSYEGLMISNSKYFMWLDPDDFIDKNWFSTHISNLENDEICASFGLLKLSNSAGKDFAVNPSNLRKFNFINSEFKLKRITFGILLPESFGLVNLLYSVWRTEQLKECINWDFNEKNLDYDIDFLLSSLWKYRIKSDADTCIVREVRGYKFDKKLNFYFFEAYRKISYVEFIREILITKPNQNRIRKFKKGLPTGTQIWIEILIFLRFLLSIFSPILIRVLIRL